MSKLNCGHEPTPTTVGTGYATIRDTGERICYRCAEEREREEMGQATRYSAYVSSDDKRVTTWTGGELAKVLHLHRNSRQTFIRAVDAGGRHWAGIGPAESGTYVSLRRVGVAS